MGLILKKTIVAFSLFLVIPLVVIAMDWHWQPEFLTTIAHYSLLITESAGSTWAIITSAFLFVLFCLLLPVKRLSQIIILWIILFLAILSGQMIKSVVKTCTKEPRPYVLWMAQTAQLDQHYFYSLPKAEKKALVFEYANQYPVIPHWLTKHWESETDYSLPSGHTLFATTWAFLALLFLGFKRHYIVVSLIIAWAVAIEVSRLMLGMHHPIDLILGILLAWTISVIGYFCAKKWHILTDRQDKLKYNVLS
ncbi:phosphatase PAP2 family protein [Orbaceae bacterium ESL0727]|nr:phosphatase PAP2 family protein [Orbaceae bacterium ESL0727]